ncbi:MAG: cation diffusion facilitator family transporter [Armatimonadia bacterium]|nr:cation diffusion facilitator family transporter [Armatimonadia bacterium]
MEATSMTTQRRKSRAAMLSVVSNTTLVIIKAAVGILVGSVSVLSEAIHSGVDLVAAVIAAIAVKTSGKPPDDEHPFGHGKVENVSGAIEALLIFGAGIWIIYEAAHKLMHPEPLVMPYWGVAVMALSVIVNILVSGHLFRVGEETDSMALVADAWHLRTDVWTSLGVAGGLAAIAIGGWVAPDLNLAWIDPVIAIIVALMILKAAYELTRQSSRDLIDASLPDDEEELIRRHIRSQHQVRGFHHLRTRKSGDRRFIEFHLMVDADMSVLEAHEITDRLKDWIQEHFPKSTITIHVEPCGLSCPPHCVEGCVLTDDEREQRVAELADRSE